MPVHNGLPFLNEAVESILSQTLDDFEFICIDDSSTDGSTDVISAVQDPRWRWERNRKRDGLSKTLNRGLRMARGKYWARMDADDISLPRRLENQVTFLEKNSDVSVVGTRAKTIGLQKEQTWRYPTVDAEIRAEMLFNSALVHSTVMLRRQRFVRQGLGYALKVDRAQDYELWTRLPTSIRFANLGQVLLRYRIHAGQVGHSFGTLQQQTASIVRVRQLRRMGLRPSRKELSLHNTVAGWQFPTSTEGLSEVESWLLRLRNANKKSKLFQASALDAALERRWWAACRGSVVENKQAWKIYSASQLAQVGERGFPDKAVFFLKSGLRV